MTTVSTDRLWELLPALHRLADIEQGRPLQALLRAIAEQAEILRQDVDRLADDFFIETCQDWVVPYIGDLVGNNLLHEAGTRARVDVAKTIYYRRRKGTVPMLEELAADITGWGAHAVEFFELLGWTQHGNHARPRVGWPDIRNIDAMDRIDGPFDQSSHTVDIRRPASTEGWHNIANIGFFLYRLRSYPVQGVILSDEGGNEQAFRPRARVSITEPNRFHFASLGAPLPLFNRWRSEGDEAGLATEAHVPGPIRPIAFMEDLQAGNADPAGSAGYYGAAGLAGAGLDECDPGAAPPDGGSLAVFADGVEVPVERILCKDHSDWQDPPPGSTTVAVDVALGRLAFAPDAVPGTVEVEYHHGFSGDVGGGPYDRRWRGPVPDQLRGWGPDTVADPGAFGARPITVAAATADHTTIQAAIDEWASGFAEPTLPPVVIEIEDDGTYLENLEIDVSTASRVVIQAANGRRPTLSGTITIIGHGPEARVAIDGLVIEGHLAVTGRVGEVRLAHCTLVPGRSLDEGGEPSEPDRPSIVAGAANPELRVVLHRSIVGAIRLPEEMVGLTVTESVIDGLDGPAIAGLGAGMSGPVSDLWQVTVLGAIRVRTLTMASESILDGPVKVERTQAGCIRFSYVRPGSVTPRRYRCQPDLAIDGLPPTRRAVVAAAMKPAYTSTHYLDPGYAQLSGKCPPEIRTGSDDGSEMGVWAHLRNPQREANLRIRLDEYLPFGLDPALIFVT